MRLLILLALACGGCDRTPSAGTELEKVKAGAAPVDPSSANANAPKSSPAKNPGLASPREHRAVLALVDFSAFPKMEGAHRQSADAVSASFSLPKKDAGDMARTVAAMESFLTAQGWKPAPDTDKAPWKDDGGAVFYLKDGAALQAVTGVSRGFASGGSDINAGLFLLGEVDARLLPRLPGSQIVREDFSASRFTSPAEVLAVRKFHTAQLTAQGWTEFRPALPASYEMTMEEKTREQSFVQNGVTVSYTLETKGAQTEVFARIGFMRRTLPLPPQPDMLELKDSPLLMSCFVVMSPAEILTWTQDVLAKDGWTSAPVPTNAERTTLHRFQKAGGKPLLLECLAGKKSTFMRLRETNE